MKNRNLGFDVPYRFGGVARKYVPDFIALLDDDAGKDDPLYLVVEVKGFRGEDAKAKKEAMDTYWVPGVNALGCHGRWAFLELRDPFQMQDDFAASVRAALDEVAADSRAGHAAARLADLGGTSPSAAYIHRRRRQGGLDESG